MRSPILPIVAALGLSATAWLTLRADTHHIDVSVQTNSSDIRMHTDGAVVSFTTSDATGFSLLTDTGKPALPVRVVTVVVPNGRRVDGVEASIGHSSVLATGVTVRSVVPTRPDPDADMPVVSHVSPTLAPSTDSGAFPSELVRYLGSGTWHGYTLASFAVFPVRAEGEKVVFYDDIDLHIATSTVGVEPGLRAGATLEPFQRSGRNAEAVLNPQDASGYAPSRASRKVRSSPPVFRRSKAARLNT
jgi:hypothetical protein